jgi:hypothetical protein
MEEVYLLSQISVDYNLSKLNNTYNNLSITLAKSDNNDVYINHLETSLSKSNSDDSIIFRKGLFFLQGFSNSISYDKKNNSLLIYYYLEFMNAQINNNISKYNSVLYNLELSFFDLKNNYYTNNNNTLDIFNNVYNKIFTRDYYFESVYFYKRRFNKMSYLFNPYLEVFNSIFNNNNTSKHGLSLNYEPSYYI